MNFASFFVYERTQLRDRIKKNQLKSGNYGIIQPQNPQRKRREIYHSDATGFDVRQINADNFQIRKAIECNCSSNLHVPYSGRGTS